MQHFLVFFCFSPFFFIPLHRQRPIIPFNQEMIMQKISLYIILFCILFGCTPKPSKVDIMRAEKARKDSITYVQAQQNLRYSDSLLQVLLPQAEPLMKSFVYSKDTVAEDHGHYVHRLLQTSSNTARNFLQAYISDDRKASIQSYYFGSQSHQQTAIRVTSGEEYIEKTGSNHAFHVEGWHEILTVTDDDALQILAFIANRQDYPIRVQSQGKQSIVYALNKQEKQALTDTYQLAVLMRDIDALERAMHVADLQIQKYEKKHTISK